MAEATTIARPYAEAVFGLAEAAGTLERWSRALAQMAQVVGHPELRAAIGDPNLSADALYALVAAGCGELAGDEQNFLRVLIENDRLALLPQIRAIYESLKNEREGVVEAQIASAYPLADGELEALVADLERRFGRRIQPRVTVDRELIGGVRVQVEDEVIDGSVRGKLAAMAAALTR
ncbi:MAG TPA: F0F1 ATP synthase subunit delta [Burkholderiales bacterium]|nr:F0F1 ATP synthase subunit delta [Burkholderiales bacterium]